MFNGDYILIIPEDESYPGKLYRQKYCYKHHYVWWKNTGQLLNEAEVIHHIDGNKYNNTFSNLMKLDKSLHLSHHSKEKGFGFTKINCAFCNKEFEVKIKTIKDKENQYGKNYGMCCSRSCQVKKQRRELKK